MSEADILYNSLTRLASTMSDTNTLWTPAMREAFLTGFHQRPAKDFPYAFVWRCRYCEQIKQSFSDTGTDIFCCGEVGHANLYLEPL